MIVLCALASVGASLQPPETVQGLDHVRALLDRGDYADAERSARQLAGTTTKERGADSIELAQVSDLLVEALVRNGQAGLASTVSLAEHTVEEKERHFGPSHLETAIALHNLGAVRLERGEFNAALALHERGLSVRLRQLPPQASAVADSLDYVALAFIRLERFEQAAQQLKRAQAIRESKDERELVALAQTLELVAWLHRYAGDYRAARAPLDRALELRRRISPDHPDMASTLQVMGDLAWHEGQVEKARAVWSEALALLERTAGPDYLGRVGFDRRLAMVTDAEGNRAQTRQILDAALQIAERSFAPCNPELMAVRVQVANSLMYDGEYSEARKRYQQSLRSCESCLGREHSRTATIVYNLAVLAYAMGDYPEAERLHVRAIAIWSSRLGPSHSYVARGLDARAEVAAARGQPEEARRLYTSALRMRRRTAEDHPDVAWTLTNLARLSADAGNLALADRYVAQAIDIFRRTGASDEPDHFARVLALRGDIETRHGDHLSARASYAEALSTREHIFGRGHPLAAESRAQLAAADLALGSDDVALAGALEAERAGRDQLMFTVRYLPERQAMAYAARRPRALDLALSIAASGDAPIPADVLDALIRSRGVILDELAARARAVGAAPQSGLNDSAAQARQRFANLVVRSLEESVDRSMLDEARRQKEDAERALAESSVEASVELMRAHIGFTDVDATLPRNSALVSFVVYERTTAAIGQRSTTVRQVRSYGAFVHSKAASLVTFVPLGTAASIDRLIRAWRAEASGGSLTNGSSADVAVRYRTVALALRRAVWDPVAAHLEGAERTFIVPDGLLNIVNIGALPGPDGRYLVERTSVIHYLSTERDLVARPSQAKGRGLLAVGGAAFGGRPAGARVNSAALRSDCEGFGDISFQNLPGSRHEVLEISKLWPSQALDDSTVLIGAAATETAVKQNFGGRRIVHLATHGFFLGGDCSPASVGMRSVGGLTKAPKGKVSTRQAALVTENPLLLAGLAFAGANRRRPLHGDQDDGILTAEEIGGLNLQGLEWAVLSACDTGLGEIKAGEGVFGLRRAFQVAGAQTVIMSLWSVEDRSAMQWMRALYEGRLHRGLDTAEAVRAASLTVLAERRARGQSTHPFYWAGFVAAGDWR